MFLTPIIIIFCFALSGFLLSRVFMYVLISKKNTKGKSGILGSQLIQNADLIANQIAEEIIQSPALVKAMDAESVLQKVRPEIEGHIDHFLEVKLKTVFPLLSQFIGAKTQGQMKGAFMDEMDRLFPDLIQKLSASFLNRESLSAIISERITDIDFSSVYIQQIISKKIQPRLDLFFSFFMLVAGIISALLVFFLAK